MSDHELREPPTMNFFEVRIEVGFYMLKLVIVQNASQSSNLKENSDLPRAISKEIEIEEEKYPGELLFLSDLICRSVEQIRKRIESLNVQDLKRELRKFGVKPKGRKYELRNQLIEKEYEYQVVSFARVESSITNGRSR